MGLVFWSFVNQPDYHLVIWLVVDRLRHKTACLHQDWYRVAVYFVWLLRVNNELGHKRGCELENYGESSVARIVIDIEPFEGKLRIASSFGPMRSGQVRRIRSSPFPSTVDVLFVCLLLEAILKHVSVHFGSRRFLELEVSKVLEAFKTVRVMFSIEIFITALYFLLAFHWRLKVWEGLY